MGNQIGEFSLRCPVTLNWS